MIDLLYRFGLGDVWIVQDVGDETLFIKKTFEQRLIDCYSQNLNSDIVSSPKASYYQHYKSFLTAEQYLSLDLNYKFRKILSNHELMIEKGTGIIILTVT